MPDNAIEHYNLRGKATPDSYIYCEIQKGMYGLPQAGIIAQQLLEERLQKHGYCQSQMAPGLWKHNTHPISFSLVVDEFGVCVNSPGYYCATRLPKSLNPRETLSRVYSPPTATLICRATGRLGLHAPRPRFNQPFP
jgi:hypothetical protein